MSPDPQAMIEYYRQEARRWRDHHDDVVRKKQAMEKLNTVYRTMLHSAATRFFEVAADHPGEGLGQRGLEITHVLNHPWDFITPEQPAGRAADARGPADPPADGGGDGAGRGDAPGSG